MPGLLVPTEAELEQLAKSLDTPEVPSKLRCGICDLLAYEAMKLPCCGQNICHGCYENELGEACTICDHKPLDKTLCEPNKLMRTTIKALLKTKFNKRAKELAETSKVKIVDSPKEAVVVADVTKVAQSEPLVIVESTGVPVTDASDHPTEPKTSITTATPQKETVITGPEDVMAQEEDEEDDSDIEIITELPEEQQPRHNKHHEEETVEDTNEDLNRNSAENMHSMNNMNQMNGMLPMDMNSMMAAANNMMPMVGFPNMMNNNVGMMAAAMMSQMSQMQNGFDPSMMMQMMNMNGMNGFQGSNSFGGMNGNGSWNNQESYNNDSYGNGNYGISAGYSMSAHQNNYNQMNEQAYASNDFQRGYGRQGYQNRRGRRGFYANGYSRGGYNQGNHQYGQTNQEQLYPQQNNHNTYGKGTDADVRTPLEKEHAAVLEASFAPGGEHDFDDELGRTPDQENDQKMGLKVIDDKDGHDTTLEISADATNTASSDAKPERDDGAQITATEVTMGEEIDEQEPKPIQAFVSDESHVQPPLRPSVSVPAVSAAPAENHMTPITTPIEHRGVGVVGAPTGPKALRSGFPSRGRGGFIYGQAGRSSHVHIAETAQQETPSEFQQGRSALSQHSRSKSRSPPRHRLNHESRQYRSSSQSVDAEKPDYPDRAHHRSHRHREEEHKYDEERNSKSSRSRYEDDVGESSSRRSKHKSRRHREEEYTEPEEEKHPSRRAHRSHEDYEDEEKQRRSSKRSRHRHEEDVDSSSKKRHRDRSRSLEHRSSGKERHRHRLEREAEYYDRRKPTEASQERPSEDSGYSEKYIEKPSRKRRSDDLERIDTDDHHDRKRSRQDTDTPRSAQFSIRGSSSKPNTPITPSFPTTGPVSRRGSNLTNGVATPLSARLIPTGPRAAVDRKAPIRQRTAVPEPLPKTEEPEFKKPEKDPHTLEREARDRERLQREMQRRAFMDVGGKKREPANAQTRRSSHKYEDEVGAEVRRVEREREGGRWR